MIYGAAAASGLILLPVERIGNDRAMPFRGYDTAILGQNDVNRKILDPVERSFIGQCPVLVVVTFLLRLLACLA